MTELEQLAVRVGDRVRGFVQGSSGAGAGAEAPGSDGRLNLLGLLSVLALGQRDRPGQPLPERSLSREVIHRILSEVAARRGVPVSREQAEKVVELLLTGELFRDVALGLGAAVRLGAFTPVALIDDILTVGDVPGDLARAIYDDLHDDPQRSPRDILLGLRTGQLGPRRRILSSTVRVLLARAKVSLIVSTLQSLIGSENETFRLALIVYARSQGIDIDEGDIQALLDALNPSDPDLGRLLDRGLERVREQYVRASDAAAFLRRIGAKAGP